jgi:hypothetical protein
VQDGTEMVRSGWLVELHVMVGMKYCICHKVIETLGSTTLGVVQE